MEINLETFSRNVLNDVIFIPILVCTMKSLIIPVGAALASSLGSSFSSILKTIKTVNFKDSFYKETKVTTSISSEAQK